MIFLYLCEYLVWSLAGSGEFRTLSRVLLEFKVAGFLHRLQISHLQGVSLHLQR